MTLRAYLTLFAISTCISWVGWIFIITHVDPFATDLLWMVLFYVSFFIAFFGLFSLIGFGLRIWFSKESRLFKYLAVSVRQGALLSFFMISLLLLQASRYLFWWNVALLFVTILLIEFLSMNSKPLSK